MLLARHRPTHPRSASLRFRSWTQIMRLSWTHKTGPGPPDPRIGMHVDTPVDPGSAPACIVQEHGVPAPVKTDASWRPAPRCKESADRYPEAESDRPADDESRPRREEH